MELKWCNNQSKAPWVIVLNTTQILGALDFDILELSASGTKMVQEISCIEVID